MQNPEDVQPAARVLKARMPECFAASTSPPVGIILGTGLSGMAAQIVPGGEIIPFSNLPGFPATSVSSHSGNFAAGCFGDLPVLIQCGRYHLYEGRTPAEICMGCRVMRAAGCASLIITNAAGALNPLFEAGTLMCMADIINHTGISPLAGPNHSAWGPRFPDMSSPFDPILRSLAKSTALDCGIRLEEGVYLAVHGPEMETPAETRMYRQWGADAVGMSTALEVIAARHMGMKVLGLSCLTNKNLPDAPAPASLEDVIAVAAGTAPVMGTLIRAILSELAQESHRNGNSPASRNRPC